MGEIDYVVPMVFPDDIRWRGDMESVGLSYERNSARWRSWGTEEQLIRLVRKNMPWLHDIIIILARESQRKPWMKGVRVVYHNEFIPQSLLPVFNVNTIEMFLHKIPGLSEQFIYGNDDMFPTSPLQREDFFRDGLPCQRMVERPFPENKTVFHLFVKDGLNMIAGDFGEHFTDTYLSGGHSIAPILKSTIEKVWERHGERIKGSFTVSRSPENLNQYIFSWYQYFTENYICHTPKSTYTSIKMPAEDIVKIFESGRAGIVCVNDNNQKKNFRLYADSVKSSLNRILSGK